MTKKPNLEQVARYARQIALPEIGPEGQAAICGARVLVVGGGLAAETARTYLTAAGVGAVETRSRRVGDGAAWLDALLGGGLVRGTSNLFMGPSGAGKTSTATGAVIAALRRGERAAYFLFD